jgi:addiction module HigA family antidote
MSSTTTLAPVTPGEVLLEEFMKPSGLSANALAIRLRVPATRIAAVLNGRRKITPETALRLGVFFSTSPKFWLNLQSAHDLQVLFDQKGDTVERDVRPLAPPRTKELPRRAKVRTSRPDFTR